MQMQGPTQYSQESVVVKQNNTNTISSQISQGKLVEVKKSYLENSEKQRIIGTESHIK